MLHWISVFLNPFRAEIQHEKKKNRKNRPVSFASCGLEKVGRTSEVTPFRKLLRLLVSLCLKLSTLGQLAIHKSPSCTFTGLLKS